MEINKKLFEDVLSGKLKGTFILRNGEEISSNKLTRNNYNSHYYKTHPYKLLTVTYTSSGLSSVSNFEYYDDIINFIPNTDMKESELTIEIPNDKTVDWDESKKQNKIVLKNKHLTYKDVCTALYKDTAPPKHQLECILAKNKLANVAKYLNGEWKPKSEDAACELVLEGKNRNIVPLLFHWDVKQCYFPQFIFKDAEMAQQAIEILGEETIKLALEPLGI